MNKEFINPPEVYAPTWQFNQAIRVTGGSLLFVSGIVGYEPDGSIAAGDIVAQAERAFSNLEKILSAAGGTLMDVVKVNVYIGEDYRVHREELRLVRERFFTSDLPVSTLVQVAGFADPNYLFEIEAIAVLAD